MTKKKKKRKSDWIMVYSHNEETTSLPPVPTVPERKNVLKSWIKKLVFIYRFLN